MKKLLLLGVVMMGVLSSCVKDAASGPVDYQKAKEEAYSNAFVQAFGGKIAANQTWGFAQGMRSAYTNSNEWASKGYVIPAAITADEITKVYKAFSEVGAESYESPIDWDCFFVQQVWKGTAEHPTHNPGQSVVGGNQMDWLCAFDPTGINWAEYEGQNVKTITGHDDHVNNFNNASGSIMLMVNSSTKRFGFKSSTDNGHIFHNFRVMNIEGSYYVGFDFEAAGGNNNEKVDRDFIYNDWIVKIVPGDGITDKVKEEGMIICEDLGTIGDFDFNDVVFYAKVWESGKTEITLLAAGGTLNLTVDGREVHEAFGVDQKIMVNTGAEEGKGATADPVYFISSNKYNGLIDIPVVVRTKDAAGNVTSYELSAEMGKAPQKICVPMNFKWCKEYKSLAEVYPSFKDWTTGAAETWTGRYDSSLVYEPGFNY